MISITGSPSRLILTTLSGRSVGVGEGVGVDDGEGEGEGVGERISVDSEGSMIGGIVIVKNGVAVAAGAYFTSTDAGLFGVGMVHPAKTIIEKRINKNATLKRMKNHSPKLCS
ncbi:MAG: hypothetical protein MJ124_00935 [Lachnospiraceae bacterium]|nr:hypothetical protein [Lachnospiraceae bacterium]